MPTNDTKLYLILLSSEHDRDAVKDFLDKSPEISFWFIAMPYSIFVKTTASPKEVFKKIQTNFGEKRMLVIEVTSSYHGRLIPNLWEHFPPAK